MRLIAAAVALLLGAAAHAQISVQAVQQVQLIAPQLVTFAGSSANFESLVGGLTAGTPVTLTTLGADGTLQIVTFVPGVTMSAADVARVLETARQNLIARGIGAPNAQQLALALFGGTLANGVTTTLPRILPANTGSALQVRNEPVSLSTPAVNTATSFSPADAQALRASLPPTTTASLSAAEFNQALQLAVGLLAQQGILDPTREQLRVALLGGNLATPNGANTILQGVLQARVRSTSESTLFGTSDSRLLGTSNSPLTGTSNSPLTGTSNSPPTLNPIVTPSPVSGTAAVRRPVGAGVPNRPGAAR